MRKIIISVKKMLLMMIGMTLILVGLISIILPFSPGLIIILIGITIIANVSHAFKNHKYTIKFKKFIRKYFIKNKIKNAYILNLLNKII